MSTLFISHSSTDDEVAKRVERRLARMGHHSVFLDLDPEKGIVAGQSWERTLYRKLRSCRAVIALCTDSYLASHWCFAEIALARMEGKPIFALKADPLGEKSRLPSILREGQYLDLRRDEEEAYGRLARGLEQIDLGGDSGDWDPKRPPYLGLDYYREEDAPVFFGRESEARSGIELLQRGAPNLIMVLGASGSGKSSLVRAGILPALRGEPDDWLVVEPMRPGRDPFTELAQALEQSWRRYAPEQAARAGGWQQIRARLQAGLESAGTPVTPEVDDANDDGAPAGSPPDEADDERVRRLVDQLEELRQRPPADVGRPFLEYLDWSLDDLRRVYWGVPGRDARGAVSTGADALLELADELRHAARHPAARVVLVVDQFEEALVGGEREERCRRFLSLLRAAFETEHAPLVCLGTMRSDFLGAFQRSPALRGVDFESLSLGPMKLDGMRRVIEEPARLAALELERGLADRLLGDAETPDALPLLSFTLWVMWRDHRKDGSLSIEEYENLGGLEGAMVREADAVLAEARRGEREDDLRRAFIRMARLTEDGQYARRPASWDTEEIARVRPILERLVERRLLVSRTEGDTAVVEVAHESLFRAWRPCRDWLDNNRSELLLRQQIARDARAWEQGGRSADLLWRGGRLRLAEELLRRDSPDGAIARLRRSDPGVERRFIREGARHRAARIRLVGTTAGAVFLVVLGLLVATLFANRRVKNEKARSEDLVRVSVSEHLLTRDPTIAGLVLLEVRRPGATGFGLDAGMLGENLAVELLHHDGAVVDARFSADGERILTTASDDTVSLWDARDGRMLRRTSVVTSRAAFSPDGKSFVTANPRGVTIRSVETGDVVHALGADSEPVGYAVAAYDPKGSRLVDARRKSAIVWDLATEKPLPLEDGEKLSYPYHVEFSPHGEYVVIATQNGWGLWDAATGKRLHGRETDNPVLHAAFDATGERLVTSRAPGARVWDVRSGAMQHHYGQHARVARAEFSPDGTLLVTAQDDGKARIWSTETGENVRELAHGDESVHLRSAVFNADASLVLTAASDGVARVFRVEDGTGSRAVTHERELTVATWGPDGRILTASLDDTARLWNPSGEAHLHRFDHDAPLVDLAFVDGGSFVVTATTRGARVWEVASGRVREELDVGGAVHEVRVHPDDVRFVTACADGTARIWDVRSGKQLVVLRHDGDVEGVTFGVDGAEFSPDGALVATRARKSVRVWNADTGAPLFGPLEYPGSVNGAEFSPDGERLLTFSQNDAAPRGNGDYDARILSAADGSLIHRLPHPAEVEFAMFAPGARQVVTATDAGRISVWDAGSGREIRGWDAQPPDGSFVAVALSPDGSRLITADKGGVTRVWDVAGGNQVARLRVAGESGVRSLAFDSRGDLLAVGSMAGPLRVWDARTWRQLYKLSGHSAMVWAVAFSPDDSLVASAGFDSTARIWPLGIDGLRRMIRDRSGACLSADYRATELGEDPAVARERYAACEEEHGRPVTAEGG